jgi:hypothetical protein
LDRLRDLVAVFDDPQLLPYLAPLIPAGDHFSPLAGTPRFTGSEARGGLYLLIGFLQRRVMIEFSESWASFFLRGLAWLTPGIERRPVWEAADSWPRQYYKKDRQENEFGVRS